MIHLQGRGFHSRFGKAPVALIVVVAVVVAAGGGLLAWWLWPSGVDAVAGMAPPDTVGVASLKVAALADEVERGAKDDADLTDAEREKLGEAIAVAREIERLDIFVSMPEGAKEPLVLVVARTDLTFKQLTERLKSLAPGGQTPPIESLGNGRYRLGKGSDTVHVADGRETGDVDEGSILFSNRAIDKAFIDSLGKGEDAPVFEVAEDADSSAPLWLAADLKDMPILPFSVQGAASLNFEKRQAKVVATFADPKVAEQMEAKAREMIADMPVKLDLQREGGTITATFSLEVEPYAMVKQSLMQARQRAMQAKEAAVLRGVSHGIRFYHADRGDYPQTLQLLVDEGFVQARDVEGVTYIRPGPEAGLASRQILLYKPIGPDGRSVVVAFADGRAVMMPRPQFEQILQAQGGGGD